MTTFSPASSLSLAASLRGRRAARGGGSSAVLLVQPCRRDSADATPAAADGGPVPPDIVTGVRRMGGSVRGAVTAGA